MAKKPFASAIKYANRADQAPKVIARGEGYVAQQIEATARLNNIPVLQDFGLSQKLSIVPIGENIPDSLYFAISNLLDYILAVERTQATRQEFNDSYIKDNIEKLP